MDQDRDRGPRWEQLSVQDEARELDGEGMADGVRGLRLGRGD